MKIKRKITGSPPVGAIYPEGSEALYEEPGTGLRLTASDYAAKHGFENAKDVEKAYQEELNGRRTAKSDDKAPSAGV